MGGGGGRKIDKYSVQEINRYSNISTSTSNNEDIMKKLKIQLSNKNNFSHSETRHRVISSHTGNSSEIHPLDAQPHRHSMLVPRVCAPQVTRCSLGKYWSRDFSERG